jgi:hypothetical protein
VTDLETVLSDFAASTREFLATLDGTTPEEWERQPAPAQWSLSQNAEHVAVVVRGVERLFTTKMLSMPLAADDPARTVRDGDMTSLMSDRSWAAPAPEMVQPKGRWPTREALGADFLGYTDGVIAWVRACPVDLRTIGAPHPRLGTLDGVQWLEFLAAHTRRHVVQSLEIRRAIG